MKRKVEQADKGTSMSKKKNNKKNNIDGNSLLNKKKIRKVDWDWESLAQQEKDRANNPGGRKIDEPKTPFCIYEGGDNEYLNKLNQVYKIKPTTVSI